MKLIGILRSLLALSSLCLDTAFAGSQVLADLVAKFSALRPDNKAAARHSGMQSGRCKLATAFFDIWSRYEELTTTLHSLGRGRTCYVTGRRNKRL
jgi:hypothetical protein